MNFVYRFEMKEKQSLPANCFLLGLSGVRSTCTMVWGTHSVNKYLQNNSVHMYLSKLSYTCTQHVLNDEVYISLDHLKWKGLNLNICLRLNKYIHYLLFIDMLLHTYHKIPLYEDVGKW